MNTVNNKKSRFGGKNTDLTVGKPFSVLWRYCLPLFGSVVFQQLYNIADSFVAGKFISENALAAVGNSYEVTLIFIAFAFGSSVGCSVVVSQLFGASKLKEMKTAVYTSFISAGILCAALMTAGMIFCDILLELIHTPPEIYSQSKLYLDIYIFGLPFVFFYNISTGVFSALGDSRTPFFFLVASSTANVATDILFVKVFNMGVPGVAWATFICQGISCLLAVFFVFKRTKSVGTDESAKLFSCDLCLRIARIAVPSILQQGLISIGNIIIQGLINNFGDMVIAGYSAAVKLNNLVLTSFTALGNGISYFTAQNIGAGKKERVHQGRTAGLKLAMTAAIVISGVYFVFAETLVKFFIKNPSQTAVETGVLFIRIVTPFFVVIASKLMTDGVFRGAGMMKTFLIASLSGLFFRVSLSMILSSTSLESTGIWMSWPIGWITSAVLSLVFYYKCEFKQKYLDSLGK